MGTPRTTLLLVLPLLAGCPFIFGGPQLPGQDTQTTTGPGTPSDADTDVDTDADADTDTDTDPTPGLPTGTPTGTPGGPTTGTPAGTPGGTPTGTGTNPVPSILSVDAEWRYDVAHILVDIDDADGDLTGGVITIDDSNTVQVLSIPSDLAAWNPSGLATIEVPFPVACGGDSRVWDVRVTDFAGNQSVPEIGALSVQGITHGEGSDPTVVGTVTPPFIACGVLSNNSDEDQVSFSFAAGGPFTFTLHDLANPPEARDLELMDNTGTVVATATGANDPDSLNHVLAPTSTYTFKVYAPGGGPGSDWSVAVHP